MRRKLWIYAISALAVPAAVAGVGAQSGMLRGSLGFEAEWAVDGTAIRPAVFDISVAAGEAASYEVTGVGMADAFDAGIGGRAELAYSVDDNVEVFGSVGYSQASGKSGVHMGDIVLEGSGELLPITASFSDLDSWSIDAGARYYAGSRDSTLRPFFGGTVGVVFVDAVDMATNSAFFNAAVGDYFESSTVFSAGVEAGIVFGDDTVSGSLSVGAKYISELDTNDEALESIGLQAFAGDSDRIVVPLKGSISLSF